MSQQTDDIRWAVETLEEFIGEAGSGTPHDTPKEDASEALEILVRAAGEAGDTT